MQKRALFLVAGVAAAAAGTPAIAAQPSNPFGTSTPYESCVAQINKNAADAFEMALTWRTEGGGLPADHCAALALLALDEPGEAASRLNALAQRSDAGSREERAALLSQSGNAWLLANQFENADTAFTAALKLTPADADILTDRGRARAARQDWANAEADLSRALTIAKKKPEIYVLRAAARRAQGNTLGFKADIDAALALDATCPEALLERGNMKLEAGDKAGARADWLQVLLRAPDSPAADSVRTHIEALEVRDP
jgi:tetratricopeptide (TPR) repeat protein